MESAVTGGVSLEQALLMRSQEVCNDLLAELSPSSDGAGPEQAFSAAAERSSAANRDPEQVLAAVPPPSAAGAAVSQAVRVDGKSLKDLKNPWNLFQNENKGKGWSPQVMAAMYKQWRSGKYQMP